MKFTRSALLTAALLLPAASAYAQDTIVIAPEQETVIREYVKREPLASIDLPGIDLTIGNPLPDKVEVRRIPDADYEYVVIKNKTYLVEPGTRRIVRVLE